MRKYRIIGSLLLLAVMCVACNPDSGKKKISIANWLEGIAMSHLAKVVLEEKGYEVELLNADVAPVFASVSRKKADVFMDAWLPVTMKDYIDQYGDQIEFIGEVYDSARVGYLNMSLSIRLGNLPPTKGSSLPRLSGSMPEPVL